MTTADYLNQLEEDRQDLVDNLETKGITGLSGSETFTQLVPQVLNIPTGGDISNYFDTEITSNTGSSNTIPIKILKKLPNITISNNVTSLSYAFSNYHGNNIQMFTISNLVTDFSYMFDKCSNLPTIPQLNTSSGTNFSYMFNSCSNLTEIPQLNTSSGTNFSYMFNNCLNLPTIPQLNTSNGTNFTNMFNGCQNLTEIPQLNTSSGTNFYAMFGFCGKLTTVPLLNMSNAIRANGLFINGGNNLTNLGGFLNLGQAYSTTQAANYNNYTVNLPSASKLTHDSLMNVINNLYDIATAGCNTQKISMGSTNLAKLSTEEIAIATNKGWTVS